MGTSDGFQEGNRENIGRIYQNAVPTSVKGRLYGEGEREDAERYVL